jgi:hypothetical protein
MAYVCTYFPHRILDEVAWFAASSGSIDMLKVLHLEGLPVLDAQTMRVAERHGYADMHKQLHFELYPEEARIIRAREHAELRELQQEKARVRAAKAREYAELVERLDEASFGRHQGSSQIALVALASGSSALM